MLDAVALFIVVLLVWYIVLIHCYITILIVTDDEADTDPSESNTQTQLESPSADEFPVSSKSSITGKFLYTSIYLQYLIFYQ